MHPQHVWMHFMATERNYSPNKFYDLIATIANGQTDSGAIDLTGLELVGLFAPAGFDGTQLKFSAAPAIDGAYVTVQDGNGTDYVLTVTPNRYIPFPDLTLTSGLRFVKLSAVTTQTGGDSILPLALRSV